MKTVCDRDWPEDFEHENGEYMNTCCECKNTFTGHKRRFICKACSTSQGGEDVAMRQRFSQIEDEIMAGKHTAASVFTQMRTAALYTHPADQVAEGVRLEGLTDVNHQLGMLYLHFKNTDQLHVALRELRALLAKGEGGGES